MCNRTVADATARTRTASEVRRLDAGQADDVAQLVGCKELEREAIDGPTAGCKTSTVDADLDATVDCAPESSVLGRLRALSPSAIGMSTGLFHEEDWSGLVARATGWSRAAIELGAYTPAALDSAVAFLRRSRPPIGYLSLHLPFALDDGGEERLVERVVGLESQVAAVVQHPDALTAPAMLAPLGGRLVLENMDIRKPGRDVAELEPYFRALPEAGLCLDVAHAKTIDRELKLAHEFLEAFGTRLREVHISGIDERGNHLPLDADAVDSFADVLRRCRKVPWILESLPVDAKRN
jgi:hypothetical protein